MVPVVKNAPLGALALLSCDNSAWFLQLMITLDKTHYNKYMYHELHSKTELLTLEILTLTCT